MSMKTLISPLVLGFAPGFAPDVRATGSRHGFAPGFAPGTWSFPNRPLNRGLTSALRADMSYWKCEVRSDYQWEGSAGAELRSGSYVHALDASYTHASLGRNHRWCC